MGSCDECLEENIDKYPESCKNYSLARVLKGPEGSYVFMGDIYLPSGFEEDKRIGYVGIGYLDVKGRSMESNMVKKQQIHYTPEYLKSLEN